MGEEATALTQENLLHWTDFSFFLTFVIVVQLECHIDFRREGGVVGDQGMETAKELEGLGPNLLLAFVHHLSLPALRGGGVVVIGQFPRKTRLQ